MIFSVQVEVSLREGVADPQGATIERSLPHLGFDGVRGVRVGKLIRFEIEGTDQALIEVPACKGVRPVEPTGVGDAFRAGFLAALGWELSLERAAQVGSVLAAYVVETVGTQEYSFTPAQFLARVEHSYGAAAAADVEPHLKVLA